MLMPFIAFILCFKYLDVMLPQQVYENGAKGLPFREFYIKIAVPLWFCFSVSAYQFFNKVFNPTNSLDNPLMT
jgi:hypothetical protein